MAGAALTKTGQALYNQHSFALNGEMRSMIRSVIAREVSGSKRRSIVRRRYQETIKNSGA